MRYGGKEPVASFSRKTGLLVNKVLVKHVNVEEPGMLVLNTQEEPQRIEAVTTMALLQPVDKVEPTRKPGMDTTGTGASCKELQEHFLTTGRAGPPQPNRATKD